jgi:hypothetical protein
MTRWHVNNEIYGVTSEKTVIIIVQIRKHIIMKMLVLNFRLCYWNKPLIFMTSYRIFVY